MCYDFNFDALKTKRMLDQESDLLDLYRGVRGAAVVEDRTLSFVQMFLKNVGVFEGCIEAHSNGSGTMILNNSVFGIESGSSVEVGVDLIESELMNGLRRKKEIYPAIAGDNVRLAAFDMQARGRKMIAFCEMWKNGSYAGQSA